MKEPEDAVGFAIRDFMEGYMDGRDASLPEPGKNRSPAYCHSFEVGRAELSGEPIPAAVSRAKAAKIIAEVRAGEKP